MRNKLLIGALTAVSFLALASTSSDPVFMTVNKKEVTKSEFEYLYNKNNQQQLEKQSLDKYLDMFVVYKLKVADAEAAGIDTTSSFIRELSGYKNELMRPYLEDKTVEDRLAKEAYERNKEEVEILHLMRPMDSDANKTIDEKNMLDSLRTCILNGEAWESLAIKYSVDPGVKRNNGHMGYIVAGKLPYSFERAAYALKVGEVSNVITTEFGFHLVKVINRRPAKGKVNVKHIMKLIPRGATPEVTAKMTAQMDSIYTLVKNGGNFEEIAKKESDDTGSARNGGELNWFGTGEMVPEFEAVSFKLEDNQISEPFATAYGIHIVKKIGSKAIDSFEEMKPQIVSQLINDERGNLAKTEKMVALKKEYNLKVNTKNLDFILADLAKVGEWDSMYVERLLKSKKVLFTYADKKVLVNELGQKVSGYRKMTEVAGAGYINRTIAEMETNAILEYEKSQLENKYPDYKNLFNEYRDGMLLFEISNQKVWDGASKDKVGLEKYFQENKSKYTWEAPKYKGLLIQVANDSIAQAVKKSLSTLGGDTIVRTLRAEFKKDIRVEKVLVGKGDNPKIDKLVFGAEAEVKIDPKFPVFFESKGQVLAQPEEAADVRGQVTADYQNVLEEKWVSELKNKYPVKINNNVLKKLKN